MTMVRPFRFDLTTGDVDEPIALPEFARRAEGLGYDGLLFTDHLLGQLGPIAAMTAAAAATEHLKVGTFVINNDLRHPVVLAQELASIDRLSGGRLIVGLGAGWNEPEYRALGLPFEAAGRALISPEASPESGTSSGDRQLDRCQQPIGAQGISSARYPGRCREECGLVLFGTTLAYSNAGAKPCKLVAVSVTQ